MTETPTPLDTDIPFRHKVRYTVALAVAALVCLFVLWTTREAVLLAFLGVALGVAFFHGSRWLAEKTGAPRGLMLALLVLLILGGLGAAAYFGGPLVMSQAQGLIEDAPEVVEQARQRVGLPEGALQIPDAFQSVGGRLLGFMSSLFGVLAAFIVVFVVAIYTAAAPDQYTNAVERLFDRKHHPFVRETLRQMGQTLLAWIKGVAIAVGVLGLMAVIGLTTLGIPGAFALAAFAAVLTVIPTFGPLIGWAPAVIVGFAQGTTTGLITLGLAVAAQQIEGSVITPKVQGQMIQVGPAFIVAGQIVLGALAGFLGILLVVPVLGVGLVALRRLYIGPFVEGEPEDPEESVTVKT